MDKFLANTNIGECNPEEIQKDVEVAFQGVLDALRIDTEDDHNTKETAKRVAKMYVQELFRGRYYPMPNCTAFPNVKQYDQIYITGPITINSTCAHHFQAIAGKCWIGVYPGDKVIGLSKFNRIADWVASRPQIQEEMTEQIADEIQTATEAFGVGVIVKATHFCMSARGVKEHGGEMITSVVRGRMREDSKMKAEFFSLLSNMNGMRYDK